MKPWVSALATYSLFTLSCVPNEKSLPAPSAALLDARPTRITPAPKPILSQRIQFFERYLKTDGISQKDQQAAQKVLIAYRQLLNASCEPLPLADREELTQALFRALLKIESMYFQQHTKKPGSLLDAGDVYIGEFRLPSGKRKFEKPVERGKQASMSSQASLQNEITPAISEDWKAREVKKLAADETAQDLNQLLGEVNVLVKSRKYKKAVALLRKAEGQATDSSGREIIIKTRERIHAEKKAGAISLKTNPNNAREVSEAAKNLLEQEKYEEAIDHLQEAERASDNSTEKELVRLEEVAVKGLINRERNRAARFFLDSKKMADPVQKREALCIARDILADLILNYPNSTEVRKVEQNLGIVEKALEKLQ